MGVHLVTGGAGFIGSALTKALVAGGAEVRVLDSFVTGSATRVPPGVDLVEGDVRDPAAAAVACRGVDAVFHQAALRSVPRSVDDPHLTNECNVTGTLVMLDAAARAGCRRFVYASSSSVYGDAPGPNVEDDLPAPCSPYAVSKLAGEHYAQTWSTLGRLSTVSLRYFNVFGPGQRPDSKYSAIFPAFISSLLDGVPPEVHWDGEQVRDFTYVDDVVAANLAAVDAQGVDGEVFNVATGSPKSVNEVLRAVSDAVGVWIEPVRTERRAGDIRATRADISKAEARLGWAPATRWRDAVESTVRWFRED